MASTAVAKTAKISSEMAISVSKSDVERKRWRQSGNKGNGASAKRDWQRKKAASGGGGGA